MWDSLGEYIEKIAIENNSNVFKVVEIGVGKFFKISEYLKEHDKIDLTLIDIVPANDEVLRDDITSPNLNIYKKVDLIYSIRPPYELQQYIEEIAKYSKAILIIKPLTNEHLNTTITMNLKSYKKANFFEYDFNNLLDKY